MKEIYTKVQKRIQIIDQVAPTSWNFGWSKFVKNIHQNGNFNFFKKNVLLFFVFLYFKKHVYSIFNVLQFDWSTRSQVQDWTVLARWEHKDKFKTSISVRLV